MFLKKSLPMEKSKAEEKKKKKKETGKKTGLKKKERVPF